MATVTELKTLIKSALTPASANFSADNALVEAICETYDLRTASAREIRAHQAEVFALIEEQIEAVLPKAVENIVGGFAEVKTFAYDAEPVFELKGMGKARARMGIVPGARAGIYKARRLDNKYVSVPVKVETVAVMVTLEEILLGKMSLAELMANIANGYAELIYINAIKALRTAKTLAPAANCKTGSGFDGAALDGLVSIARAYGSPVIMGFRSALSKINNGAGWDNVTPNISAADADDIRRAGVIAMYHGVPVVELPNYLVDETNSGFVFSEGDIFVLPAESRPVKVAMKGDLVIVENQHATGSMEQQAHRLMGVGLVLANNVCVYTDSSISGGIA